MLLSELLGGSHHLHGHKLVALALEAANDLTNEATLHGIRLEHDEGALLGGTEESKDTRVQDECERFDGHKSTSHHNTAQHNTTQHHTSTGKSMSG